MIFIQTVTLCALLVQAPQPTQPNPPAVSIESVQKPNYKTPEFQYLIYKVPPGEQKQLAYEKVQRI